MYIVCGWYDHDTFDDLEDAMEQFRWLESVGQEPKIYKMVRFYPNKSDPQPEG